MEYRKLINDIKVSYFNQEISYEEAKEKVEKLLLEMNQKGAEIARKNGFKYKKLTFQYVFR